MIGVVVKKKKNIDQTTAYPDAHPDFKITTTFQLTRELTHA
jgi:hypothetical protein